MPGFPGVALVSLAYPWLFSSTPPACKTAVTRVALAYPWLLSLHASGVKEILVIALSEVLHDLTALDWSTELIKTFGEPLVEKGPVVRDLHGIAVNR